MSDGARLRSLAPLANGPLPDERYPTFDCLFHSVG